MNAPNTTFPIDQSVVAGPSADIRDATVQHLLQYVAPYLNCPTVNEIAINRPGELWQKKGAEWFLQKLPGLTHEKVEALSRAICVYNGVDFDTLNSVQLPSGERVQVNQPPATLDGCIAVNIRNSTSTVKSLEELERDGTFSDVRDVSFNKPDEDKIQGLLGAHDFTRLDQVEADLLRLKAAGKWREFLQLAVESKRNIMISGSTGSGKTTFARSLIDKVSPDERIVTFEDVHELKLPSHPNRVHMIYGTGKGRVTAKDCLKAAMRMSPDRIFPAEIRGDEAWDYLNSLNTGHPGSITTIHANNALETFGRFFFLVMGAGSAASVPTSLVQSEIYKTVHITLFLHHRKLLEVFYDPIFSKTHQA